MKREFMALIKYKNCDLCFEIVDKFLHVHICTFDFMLYSDDFTGCRGVS